MYKVIGFIIVICFYAFFAAVNMSNVSDINLGIVIKNVPVFLTVTVSFALGCIFSLFLIFGTKFGKKKKDKVKTKAAPQEEEIPEKEISKKDLKKTLKKSKADKTAKDEKIDQI